MAIMASLPLVLLALGLVRGAPSPDTQGKASCIRRYGGLFTTSGFVPKGEQDLVFPPYYFNSKGEIAYDKKNPSGHPPIYADFQTCTPNYAQESNPDPDTDGVVYGRFYVPSLNKCLAVTNPSGNPPYFLGTAPCPSAKDMSSKKSIPFNFVSDETGGEVDIRWLGGTILKKGIYQGPNPPAKYCHGQYYVNATNPEYGYDYPYLGEPNTVASDNYRVHLYCPYGPDGKGTGHNSFLVPPYNRTGSS
ncbi:hypothetical protein RhiJN_10162 [Ceratobasidium sp. AG-Ba]|nr:hypothetical protein RhiJN_10162 [Ceratobasidium sp. AG-Ba]QRW10916.1 hypothetical protein RhiLY_09915 [Ceratobasidium sp. AG-Ba]